MSRESPSAIAKQARDFLIDLACGEYDVELKEAEEKLTAIGVPWAIMAREALHAFVTIYKATALDAVQPDGECEMAPTTNCGLNPKTVPKPMTFKTVYAAMTQYRERAAPGGTCDAWTDFADHTRKRLGHLPWNLRSSVSVSRQFADYWLTVADGASPDYDAATGAWIDTADPAKKPRRSNQRGSREDNKMDWSKIRLMADHPAAPYNRPVLDLGDGHLALGPFDVMPHGYGAPLADAFVRMNRERFDPQLVDKFLQFENREAEWPEP